MPREWTGKRKEWERQLIESGYEETLRLLKDVFGMVSVDQLGQVSPDRHEDIRRATAANDLDRVQELLADSAKELKDYFSPKPENGSTFVNPRGPSFATIASQKPFRAANDFHAAQTLAS